MYFPQDWDSSVVKAVRLKRREKRVLFNCSLSQFLLFPLAATMPPSVTSLPPVVTSEPPSTVRPCMDVLLLLLWGLGLKFRSDVIVCLLKMSGVLYILCCYSLGFARKHLEIINSSQIRGKWCRKLTFLYSVKELVVVLL